MRIDMNPTDLLVEAQKAVDKAKISDDLREVAFGRAFDMLCRQSAGPTSATPPLIEQSNGTAAPGHDETPAAKIARKLGVSTDTIKEVFAVDAQGGLEVVVGVGKLDQATAGATKELAILVSGARQLSEREEWTPSKEIRRNCVHYGRFDPANFAKTLRQMDDAFSFRGKAQQLQVRLHQRGIERLKALIGSLTGE